MNGQSESHDRSEINSISVDGGDGTDTMAVDDSGTQGNPPTGPYTYTITDKDVDRSGSKVNYSNIESLDVMTSQAADDVLVRSTAVPTTVFANGGDAVWVGNGYTVQGIRASLSFAPTGHAASITVNDSADFTVRDVILDAKSIGVGSQILQGTITGLAPADITYFSSSTSDLSVWTGGGVNRVYVRGTAVPTSVIASNRDKMYVGNLDNSVQDIQAPLTFAPMGFAASITVNDSADPETRNVTLDAEDVGSGFIKGTISGLAPADISYFNRSTGSVSITTGTAADTVNVGAGALDSIRGAFTVNGGGGTNTMTIDDSASPAPLVGPSTYVVSAKSVQRLGTASITYSGMSQVLLKGSNTASTYDIIGARGRPGVDHGRGRGRRVRLHDGSESRRQDRRLGRQQHPRLL